MSRRRTRSKTPQEKKQHSYDKDRRNNYGENDKSSRLSIRRNKRTPNRVNRRRAHDALNSATGVTDTLLAEHAEQKLHAKRAKRWRKWPDLPLAAYVEGTLERRSRLEDSRSRRIEASLRRIRRKRGAEKHQGKRALPR